VSGGRDVTKIAAGGATVVHAVRNSRAVEGLARAGLFARGVVYLVVALLTVQVAVGKPAKTDDQNGAIQEIAAQPFGRVVLIALAFGFGSYALWRFSVAAAGAGDQSETAGKRIARRLAALATGVVYAGLCVTTVRVLSGGSASSSTERQQKSVTAWALELPFGRGLVIAIGAAVIIGGLVLLWWAGARRFTRNLETATMGHATRAWATGFGVAGIGTGGVVAGLVGIFVLQAGIANNPNASRGLDQTLRTVATAPFGRPLVAAIAIGFAAYGIYSFFEARYRDV
jgi:hypothetical protein